MLYFLLRLKGPFWGEWPGIRISYSFLVFFLSQRTDCHACYFLCSLGRFDLCLREQL